MLYSVVGVQQPHAVRVVGDEAGARHRCWRTVFAVSPRAHGRMLMICAARRAAAADERRAGSRAIDLREDDIALRRREARPRPRRRRDLAR